MRVLLQLAFLLHRRPYRNSSLLLDVFCREQGRLSLVARGAISPRSGLKGILQPFRPLLLSWSGKGELCTLIGAEEEKMPVPLPPKRVLSGLYVNELLMYLLPRRDACPDLFTAYANLLKELAVAANEEPPLRRFEKCLLDELGYGLSLEQEAVSGLPIVAENHYCYVLDQGVRAVGEAPVGISISGRGLLALRDGIFDTPDVLQEAKHLMRAALLKQLQGRVLKTRELYRIKREQ